jgi:Spy/CpxP family protein refolding chaperone
MKALILAGLAIPALVTTVHGNFHAHLHETIARKLDLTADQKVAAHAVIEAHKPALHAKLAAVIQARADLLQAIANPATTEAQIRTLDATASAAHVVMELELSQVVKEFAPILTPDQHEKAQKLILEARAHVDAFSAAFMADAK